MPRTIYKTANPSKFAKKPTITSLSKMAAFLRIYRKFVSNLKIREEILRKTASSYAIGPTIIWTEDVADISIFTTSENYSNFIGFESPFNNPSSKQYLGKIIKKMRMVKGTILVKEATPVTTSTLINPMHIPVHFCAYRVDEAGVFTIFDPSWHGADPGIYSTTAFYESLDAFNIPYSHALPNRKHHWQSRLPDDVFCQTWTLRWLYDDDARFPLPSTRLDAAKHIAGYIREFVRVVQRDISAYSALFPTYKLEGNSPEFVFQTILSHQGFVKTIHDLF